jgi:hypothetical protein
MRITPTGSVGIGTTTPGSRLVVQGSGTTDATSALNVTNSTPTSLLFVRDDGNVGIGTSSPARALSIGTAGSANGQLIFQATGSSSYGNAGVFNTNSNGDKVIFYNDGTSYDARIGVGSVSNLWIKAIGTSSNTCIQFVTGTNVSSAERMRITSTGNVGIGTTSPASTTRLQIQGSGTTDATSALNVTNSTPTSLLFVRNDGNVGIGTTGPYTLLHLISTTDGSILRLERN